MSKRYPLFALSAISLACATSVFAATPVDLSHQSIAVLQSLTPAHTNAAVAPQSSLKQISRDVDFNQTAHIRFQQTYAGYPVWGSDSVMHVPHNTNATLTSATAGSTMNGTVYQNLNADLNNAPAYIFSQAQADKAVQTAVGLYQKKTGVSKYHADKTKTRLMVYIDKANKAHWAFRITISSSTAKGMPALPTYILDAITFTVYEEWNNLQNAAVSGGGFGGNPKMGKLVYDGLANDLPKLTMQRDSNTCTLKNSGVTVYDNKKTDWLGNAEVAKFTCKSPDAQHNNVYWSGNQDATNGAYSPANDALYIGQMIKEMYEKWYGIPVLSENGRAMMLKMNVHVADEFGGAMENAYFNPETNEMYYGDGESMFYPLTSLGVGAHEVSHGFTSQHANLTYEKQSGGLNEAFSDMAAAAADYYSTGRNNWQIGPEIVKGEGALRYMDDPTKDGQSIGNARDYNDSLDVHLTSGVYNKAFYLLATAPGWNTKKAFDVMVKANMNYWTANTTFAAAACGVMKATQDYRYDVNGVKKAMQGVGIDVSRC
jgi:pseudolysin